MAQIPRAQGTTGPVGTPAGGLQGPVQPGGKLMQAWRNVNRAFGVSLRGDVKRARNLARSARHGKRR